MAEDNATSTPLHLAIVGGGIAGCAAASWAATRGVQVTIFNAGLPLGGTCIHVGMLPARMLMTAATDHHRALHPRFEGLNTSATDVDWKKVEHRRAQMGERVRDRMRSRLHRLDNVELIEGRAHFEEEMVLSADNKTWEPDRVLLTPGTRSTWPDVEGLDDVDAWSLSQLSRLDSLPERIAFIGTSDVALSYSQLMARMGTEVMVFTDRHRLLGEEHGDDIDGAVVDMLRDEGVDVATAATVREVSSGADGQIAVRGDYEGAGAGWNCDAVVVVDNRQPRIAELHLERSGVELTDDGFIVIDESMQTTQPNIFAAGDAIGRGQHAYAAAYDAILAARNAVSPSKTAGHNTAVPFAIYTDPQFAGVGWGEPGARRAGFVTDTANCQIAELPVGEALGLKRGFVKLIRDRRSDHLVGARILAPGASELVMELALAVRYGLTVSELASLIHPPISLGEAVGRAARTFMERRPRPAGESPSVGGGRR